MSIHMSTHIDSSVPPCTLTHCHKLRHTHLLTHMHSVCMHTHMHSVRVRTHMHSPVHSQISSVHIVYLHSPSHPFPHAHTVHSSKTMLLDMCVHRDAVTQMLGSRRAPLPPLRVFWPHVLCESAQPFQKESSDGSFYQMFPF